MNADRVFKALADTTRRYRLDVLFEREGQTLTQLESRLDMTRFRPPIVQPHDLAGAEERLHEFLIGRFGGPPR